LVERERDVLHSDELNRVHNMQDEAGALRQMQWLLLRGRRSEACNVAVEHHLWAHALLLSSYLGADAYKRVISQFAMRSCREGSPMESLYLLLSLQPHLLFRSVRLPQEHQQAVLFQQHQQSLQGGGAAGASASAAAAGTAAAGAATGIQALSNGGMPLPLPRAADGSVRYASSESRPEVIRNWRRTVAVALANRVPGDKAIILQLGDTLWSVYGQVCAAQFCYLVAEQQLGSDLQSRLVLIGADHRLRPRTFVSPQAIQRTELYEYAKRKGNPQFNLPALQV